MAMENSMKRLKPKEVAGWRAAQIVEQFGRCALCRCYLDPLHAVADHCHKTGKMRGSLHRGCNAWLGKTENCIKINGLEDKIEFLVSPTVLSYMKSTLDVYHPTYRTDEEKRLRRNKKARKRREAKSKRV